MKGLKAVFYWMSVILPVIDALRGIKSGIKKGRDDAAIERQRQKWERANRE